MSSTARELSRQSVQTDSNRNHERHEFTGVELGFGTSYRESHTHAAGDLPARGTRCSGCRWTETKILWSEDGNQYVISIIGRSEVPGEIDRVKTIWTDTPDGVLDALLVPPPRHIRKSGPLEMPQPNVDALEEAAEADHELDLVFTRWEREDRG